MIQHYLKYSIKCPLIIGHLKDDFYFGPSEVFVLYLRDGVPSSLLQLRLESHYTLIHRSVIPFTTIVTWPKGAQNLRHVIPSVCRYFRSNLQTLHPKERRGSRCLLLIKSRPIVATGTTELNYQVLSWYWLNTHCLSWIPRRRIPRKVYYPNVWFNQ